MSVFQLYFKLGVEHITDIQGYDHILFLVALCIVYSLRSWKKLVILITAFTLGHTATLALAVSGIINISSSLIEFLIPITIFFTAFINLFRKTGKVNASHIFKYLAAMFFGLIHGLGFSNYLQSLLGKEGNLLLPLFAFNLGIETGQLMIVAVILSLTIFFIHVINVKQREWNLLFSGAVMGISLIMIMDRLQDL